MRELEIYIHIPFCVRKCKYCDFLSAPATKQVQNAYMEALLREIKSARVSDCIVVSVFVGGGTPTAVEPEWIARVMESVRETFVLSKDAEISMEMNPGTVTQESLAIYKRVGINRLSIGLQSTHDAELQQLGRIHSYRQFLDTYQMVRQAGFDNVNVDLMSGLPGQSLKDWEENLLKITELIPPPEHISAYSLIVEEGTCFYELYEKGELALPDEDVEREMYWRTAELLKKQGYHRYEISNYAKEGYECRHNCGYWTRRDYLGFGIGAASLFEEKRWKNIDSLQEYLNAAGDCHVEEEILTLSDRMEETMFLGLRMICGVDGEEFKKQYGSALEEVFGEQIEESIKEGLLQKQGTGVALTERGLDLSNYVMAKFVR